MSKNPERLNMKDPVNQLAVAKTIHIAPWATHVAVSTTRDQYAENAYWQESIRDYIDEDPAGVCGNRWIGGYKRNYWVFIPREVIENNLPWGVDTDN
ncbi:hypothetical protein EniLVp02_0180 [Vibrio phage EniLVp02]